VRQVVATIDGRPRQAGDRYTLGNQTPRPAAVASMALYNACCDRAPVYMMVGNTVDATKRAPGGEWVHSVQDAAATVRDFVKWDDDTTFGRFEGRGDPGSLNEVAYL
jgi:acetolactate synthase I/II/III large subunit